MLIFSIYYFRVYKTVYAHDLPYQSHGEFKADYITVEHNTGLNLHVSIDKPVFGIYMMHQK